MSYAKGTEHYNLPLTQDSDVRTWDDTNEAFSAIDTAIFNASNKAIIEQIYETTDNQTFETALEAISDKILSLINITNITATKLILDISTDLETFPTGIYVFDCSGIIKNAVNFSCSYIYTNNYGSNSSTTHIAIRKGTDSLIVAYGSSGGANYTSRSFSGKIYTVR